MAVGCCNTCESGLQAFYHCSQVCKDYVHNMTKLALSQLLHGEQHVNLKTKQTQTYVMFGFLAFEVLGSFGAGGQCPSDLAGSRHSQQAVFAALPALVWVNFATLAVSG